MAFPSPRIWQETIQQTMSQPPLLQQNQYEMHSQPAQPYFADNMRGFDVPSQWVPRSSFNAQTSMESTPVFSVFAAGTSRGLPGHDEVNFRTPSFDDVSGLFTFPISRRYLVEEEAATARSSPTLTAMSTDGEPPSSQTPTEGSGNADYDNPAETFRQSPRNALRLYGIDQNDMRPMTSSSRETRPVAESMALKPITPNTMIFCNTFAPPEAPVTTLECCTDNDSSSECRLVDVPSHRVQPRVYAVQASPNDEEMSNSELEPLVDIPPHVTIAQQLIDVDIMERASKRPKLNITFEPPMTPCLKSSPLPLVNTPSMLLTPPETPVLHQTILASPATFINAPFQSNPFIQIQPAHLYEARKARRSLKSKNAMPKSKKSEGKTQATSTPKKPKSPKIKEERED